jgi:hypothetical protein
MEYLGLEAPGSPWSKRSRGLAEGLMVYERSINAFGIPLSEATNDEMDGWYEVDDSKVDHAVAALQRWEKETKKPEPGVIPRIVDTRYEAEPVKRSTTAEHEEEQPASRLTERGLDD